MMRATSCSWEEEFVARGPTVPARAADDQDSPSTSLATHRTESASSWPADADGEPRALPGARDPAAYTRTGSVPHGHTDRRFSLREHGAHSRAARGRDGACGSRAKAAVDLR